MKTITIPKYKNPFIVVINNNVYQYRAGETIEVPDEVADIIANIEDLTPKEDPRAGKALLLDFISTVDRSITNIDVPKGTTVIGTYAFAYCFELSAVTLHDGLETIEASAFSRDAALKSIEIPSTVTAVSSNAFYACTGLEKVVFLGIPTTINSTAFADCTGLKDIYVPWEKGKVANAPWGATNATVHYKE